MNITVDVGKASNTSFLNSIEINHHGVSALTVISSIAGKLVSFKIVSVRFELLPYLIILALNSFRIGLINAY